MNIQHARLLTKDWWGPIWWQHIHAWTFTLPETPTQEEQKAAQVYFEGWIRSIPCFNPCRVHTSSYFQEHPVDWTSRDNAARALVDYHNKVNVGLGKRVMPFAEAVAYYMAMRAVPLPRGEEEQANFIYAGIVAWCHKCGGHTR